MNLWVREKGPKITGQTKAWIKWNERKGLYFFIYFFSRGSPSLSLSPRSLGAHSHSDFLVARLRHLQPPSIVWGCFSRRLQAAFVFIHNLKFKRAEMETCALPIRETPGTVQGTSVRSVCTKPACSSDVPWKQRQLLITSTNSHSRRIWREVENFKSHFCVPVYV